MSNLKVLYRTNKTALVLSCNILKKKN